MQFQAEYDKFINHHISRRKGERRGRLERGHQHAETLFLKNVWWPIQHDFDHLHPEYEITDWRGRSYFGDFAYLPPGLKLIIEIKGYGPHVQDMNRQKYCDELNRELFIQTLGFRIISFAYDDVKERPDTCIFMLRMLLSRYKPSEEKLSKAKLAEKEVVVLALTRSNLIRPKDVEDHLNMTHRSAVKLLRSLVDQRKFEMVLSGKGEKVRYYRLNEGHVHLD